MQWGCVNLVRPEGAAISIRSLCVGSASPVSPCRGCFVRITPLDGAVIMSWEDEKRAGQVLRDSVLHQHGLTEGDWAILITAFYCVPLPKQAFIECAAWESMGRANQEQVALTLDQCLIRGLVRFVKGGHIEHGRNVFGQSKGNATEYPDDGVVQTEAGHDLHSRVCFAIFGENYFGPKAKTCDE